MVAEAGGGKPRFRSSVDVRAKDAVIIRTKVSNAKEVPEAKLRIAIDRGPGKTLTVSAGGLGTPEPESAEIESSTGKPIKLTGVSYRCAIGPNSFCPLDKAVQTERQYEVVLTVPARQPVVLTGKILGGK